MPPKYYNETLQIHKITSKQIHNSNIPLLVHISDVLLSVFWWKKNSLTKNKNLVKQRVYFSLQIPVYHSEKSGQKLKQELDKETMKEFCLAGSLSYVSVL